jgi:hypothetical protein
MQGKHICKKHLLIVWLTFISGTSLANTNHPTSSLGGVNPTVTQTATRKEVRPARAKALVNHVKRSYIVDSSIDDNDDDDADILDLHIGYRRPRVVDNDDEELSDYVKLRLAVAQSRAMAIYRSKSASLLG